MTTSFLEESKVEDIDYFRRKKGTCCGLKKVKRKPLRDDQMDLAKMRIENEIFPLAQTPFHLMFPYTCCCCRGCHRNKEGYETDIAKEELVCDKKVLCSEIKEHKNGVGIQVPIHIGSSYLYKINKTKDRLNFHPDCVRDAKYAGIRKDAQEAIIREAIAVQFRARFTRKKKNKCS